MWTPEQAQRRRERAAADPEYRARRNAQGNGKDPERRREYMRRYYLAHRERWDHYNARRGLLRNARRRERCKRHARQGRLRNPRVARNAKLRYAFGVGLVEYERLLAAQGGGCAICGAVVSDRWRRRLAVDHCHDTGRVRGLLCARCNFGLGQFRDDPGLLARAIAYLQAGPLVGGVVRHE